MVVELKIGERIHLPERGKNRERDMRLFAESLSNLRKIIGFKVSARGWCYQLEGFKLITKAEFDKVERIINECRKCGILPVDFTAEEESRQFSGVEDSDESSPIVFMREILEAALICEKYYTPDWWEDEEYYIQMLVEKIDLKTLFEPVCTEYHIPIATSKGWSSILQRAKYANRFKRAEEKGLKCVLLYCGDHDPDGLRISDFLRKNLRDLASIEWENRGTGYNPRKLIIDRFGLNYDFIIENNLTWIDNLLTGSKRDLADPTHPNHQMDYIQEYLRNYGVRKCEANAIVVIPDQARLLCQEAIEKYLGQNARERFRKKRTEIKRVLDEFREETGLDTAIQKAIDIIDEEETRERNHEE